MCKTAIEQGEVNIINVKITCHYFNYINKLNLVYACNIYNTFIDRGALNGHDSVMHVFIQCCFNKPKYM